METVFTDHMRVRRIEMMAAQGHDSRVIADFVGCSHLTVCLIVDRWQQKEADKATGISIKGMALAMGIAADKAGKPSGLGSLAQDVQNGAGSLAGPVNADNSHVVPGVVGSEAGKLVGAEVSAGKVAAILLDEILKGTDVRHKWSHHGDPRYEQMAKLLGTSKRVVHRVVVVHDRKDLSIDDEASADVVIVGGKVIKNLNGPVGWSVERIYQGVEGAL